MAIQRRIPITDPNELKQVNQQQMMSPLDYHRQGASNYSQAPPDGTRLNAVILEQQTPAKQVQNASTTSTTKPSLQATTQAPQVDFFPAPSNPAWFEAEVVLLANSKQHCLASLDNNKHALECNLKGSCDKTTGCSCYAGFSGPTCALGESLSY